MDFIIKNINCETQFVALGTLVACCPPLVNAHWVSSFNIIVYILIHLHISYF